MVIELMSQIKKEKYACSLPILVDVGEDEPLLVWFYYEVKPKVKTGEIRTLKITVKEVYFVLGGEKKAKRCVVNFRCEKQDHECFHEPNGRYIFVQQVESLFSHFSTQQMEQLLLRSVHPFMLEMYDTVQNYIKTNQPYLR